MTGDTRIPFNTGPRIKLYEGLVFGSKGEVIDPATSNIVGTFPLNSLGSDDYKFILVPEHNRILFLNPSTRELSAFELNSFRPIGSLSLPSVGLPTDMERWGTNGLAVSHSNGPILLIRSTLVNPNEPVPTATPTPTPTPTPLPTPVSSFVRRVAVLSNDIIHSPANAKIYASIPGLVGGEMGNTITTLDPRSGLINASVAVGSEPNKLALSEDEQSIFVSLDGPNAIRRFDLPSQTAGSQFPLDNPNGQRAQDLAIAPGSPNLLAVASGVGGAAIYDNGLRRPNIVRESNPSFVAPIGALAFSSNPAFLYGYNNQSTTFDLYRVSVDATGLNRISNVRNLISGFQNSEIIFAEGKIFAASGVVADPEANSLFGTFAEPSGSSLAVDTALRKVFIASPGSISVYDMDTFLKLGSIPYSGAGTPVSTVRWGENGLAVRMHVSSINRYINLIQSPLVSAAGELPTGFYFNTTLQSIGEGNPYVAVAVKRSGDISGTSSVNYVTSGESAAAGSDFVGTSGTLTFAPGESLKGNNDPTS